MEGQTRLSCLPLTPFRGVALHSQRGATVLFPVRSLALLLLVCFWILLFLFFFLVIAFRLVSSSVDLSSLPLNPPQPCHPSLP